MKLPFSVYDIIKTLNLNNFEAYVVGGAVRNELLSLPINDYDVTTNAKPNEVIKIFKDKYIVVPTGLKHGTVTLINQNKKQIEVTTFRHDSTYKDNRHPDNVTFLDSYKEDSKRRDFTINALYYDMQPNEILDPTDFGLHDIKYKLIRAIGNPDDRFNEDALRILRAIRFLAILKPLGFSIEEKTKDSIFRNKDLLKNIAGERIREELNKIMLSDCVYDIFTEFFKVFEVIIPELSKCKGFMQTSKYHKFDVLDHLLYATQCSIKSLVIRYTCLFHDLGKPDSCQYREKFKRNVFVNHEKYSVRLAINIMDRLKFPNNMRNRILPLIMFHDNTMKIGKRQQFINIMNKIGPEALLDLVEVKRGDELGHDLDFSKNAYFDELRQYTIEFIESLPIKSIREMNYSGNDLIRLGFTPSVYFKRILLLCYTSIIRGDLNNNHDEIESFIIKFFTINGKPSNKLLRERLSTGNTILNKDKIEQEINEKDHSCDDEIDEDTDDTDSDIKYIIKHNK